MSDLGSRTELPEFRGTGLPNPSPSSTAPCLALLLSADSSSSLSKMGFGLNEKSRASAEHREIVKGSLRH